ncbi:hypothetical protein OOT00_07295 [Desulfobotulus sp. H1]|uniref:Peptidase S54 rhomboid domain-containing protein n=1 Tax=Desulfobotulus pelophilus TaxID=2823377 RepID=A0ABT3N8K5_9BACT|nr:hypothetical protein [Desulfobotulus pelophilus]MCW7753785.1 hypothetical protein [Desulfobotulus pelophilus]
MLRALFYKEWIKLRWPVAVLGLLGLASLLQAGLSLRYLATMREGVDLWEGLILKQQMPYGGHLVFPMVCGLVMGAFQWFPETRKRRLRLLLHLPLAETVLIPVVVATGLLFVFFVAGLHGLGLMMVYALRFPHEIVAGLAWAWLPHMLAGMVFYCGAAMVLMETSWWRRIMGACLVYGLVTMLTSGTQPAAYAQSAGAYVLVTLTLALMLFLPVMRAKRGGGV